MFVLDSSRPASPGCKKSDLIWERKPFGLDTMAPVQNPCKVVPAAAPPSTTKRSHERQRLPSEQQRALPPPPPGLPGSKLANKGAEKISSRPAAPHSPPPPSLSRSRRRRKAQTSSSRVVAASVQLPGPGVQLQLHAWRREGRRRPGRTG